jgi:hypothetical protein
MARRTKRNAWRPSDLIRRFGGWPSIVRLCLVALLATGLAYLSFALAVAGIARHRAPAQALFFVPWEGTAIATQDDLALLAGKKFTAEQIEARMRRSLQDQPINAKALRLLATAADLRGDKTRAERLLTRSVQLTRRDMISQLWMIEFAADRNDMIKVLRHFDTALRTSRKAEAVLFPRLTLAIRNPEVRSALKPYIERKVEWVPEFFGYAIRSQASSANLVNLFVETGGPRDEKLAAQLRTILLGRLFNSGDFAEMRRLYLADPKGDPKRLTDVRFDGRDVSQALGPVGWQLVDEVDAGAAFITGPTRERPAMHVYANTAVTRVVARKTLFLSAGQYDLRAATSGFADSDGAAIGWQLRCLDPLEAAMIQRVDNVAAMSATGFSVPAGCKVQLLEVLAFGGQGAQGMDASLLGLTLTAS